jgi:hypothetical protein
MAPKKNTENEAVIDGTKSEKTTSDEATQQSRSRNSVSNRGASDRTAPEMAVAVAERATTNGAGADSTQIHSSDERGSETKTANKEKVLKPVPQDHQAAPLEIVVNGARDSGKMNNKIVPTEQEAGEKYCWRMIGECYVHGMMDGEAIAWQDDKQVRAEVFDLR